MIQFLRKFWETQKTIWIFLGTQKKKYVFFNALILVIFFYDLVPALVFGKIVDFFTQYTQGDSLKPFYLLAGFLAVSWTIVSVLRISCKNALGKVGIHAKTNARVQGLEQLLDLSAEWHSTQNSGNRLQQIFTGSSAILEAIQLQYREVWKLFANFIGVLAIFLFLSPAFLVFAALYTLFFFIIEFYFNRKIYELTELGNRQNEKSSGSIIESAHNIVTIKSLGSEQEIHSHLSEKEEISKQIQIQKVNIKGLKWISFHILNGIALGTFLLLIGYHVVSSLITIGSILVFFSYYNKLRETTQEATDNITNFIELASNIGRLREIFSADSNTRRDGKVFPKEWQKVVFTDVAFTYAASDKGLKNLTLEIPRGEILGVAGSSGGGKSTLAKLLIDLHQPKSGGITVDSLSYPDISHKEILKAVSIVPQEAELFNLSLVDNITILRPVHDELLRKVIKVSELESVIEKLPEGLQTLIGEKGYSLSGGERQRVGIARALYKNAELVIFDEATSSLDGSLERKIIENVLYEFKGKKTFIFIAHRLSALEPADRIIVLKNGSIEEEGTYLELKQRKGLFAELFRTQLKEN
jgi:ABC-type multidrug transport system fused ATPase/permease subunit